jgi:hypothetical protein
MFDTDDCKKAFFARTNINVNNLIFTFNHGDQINKLTTMYFLLLV